MYFGIFLENYPSSSAACSDRDGSRPENVPKNKRSVKWNEFFKRSGHKKHMIFDFTVQFHEFQRFRFLIKKFHEVPSNVQSFPNSMKTKLETAFLQCNMKITEITSNFTC